MKSFQYLFLVVALLGCQAEPNLKKVPKPVINKVEKGLNNVSFNPAVDILFIIDDSGSMSRYQEKLAANADLFIEKFFKAKFIDFHIGVTSSSTQSNLSKAGDGKLHRVDKETFVERTTPDKEILLAEMMNIGTSGSGTERFLNVPELTFGKTLVTGFNKGFYRPNAQLAIIVVTDTEDQSRVTPDEAYEFVLELKNNENTKIHYVAAVIEQNASCPQTDDYKAGPRKLKAMMDFFDNRGHQLDLCKANYGEDMARIAEGLVKAVSTIYLDELPDITTLKVAYGNIIIPNDPITGWVYNAEENAIVLSPNIDIQDQDLQQLKITFESVY